MFQEVLDKQRHFFRSGITKTYQFRLTQLNLLHQALQQYEHSLLQAVELDLGKSTYEGYITELAFTFEELNLAKRNLKKWMKPKRVKSSLTTLFGKSQIFHEPYGNVCIISPWNYPIQLSIVPLISAIASGNTIMLKVSTSSFHTANILIEMMKKTFDESYIFCTDKSTDEQGMLISLPFDYIFFTGSTKVGKLIMEEASKNLVPVTLELGGKSPCIVDESADIDLASKRIVLGKMINSGQTCVAPDYILVHHSIKEKLIASLWETYCSFYVDTIHNVDHPKIINASHLEILISMLENQTILKGGEFDNILCKMELTLLDQPLMKSNVMIQEIFGPILPIISYDTIDEAIGLINQLPKPLALYYYSNNQTTIKQVIQEVSFGGGAINDSIMHLTNSNLPFGGVGSSGMGSYHGKYGFDTFSHQKSILFGSKWFDLPIKYPPFQKRNVKLVKRLFK